MDKIVQTYRERKTIDKYSYVASLAEIAENDYNLNIPRYVDTFEEKEPVDLDATAAETQQLDAALKSNNAVLKAFCEELGIRAPF